MSSSKAEPETRSCMQEANLGGDSQEAGERGERNEQRKEKKPRKWYLWVTGVPLCQDQRLGDLSTALSLLRAFLVQELVTFPNLLWREKSRKRHCSMKEELSLPEMSILAKTEIRNM